MSIQEAGNDVGTNMENVSSANNMATVTTSDSVPQQTAQEQTITTNDTQQKTTTKKPRQPRKRKEPVVAAKQSEELKQESQQQSASDQSIPEAAVLIDTSKPDGIGETVSTSVPTLPTTESQTITEDKTSTSTQPTNELKTKAINKISMGGRVVLPSDASKLKYKWERRFINPNSKRSAFDD